MVLNELYGAGADAEKFIELYNNGDTPIKLKDVTIKKDEELVWTGIEGEVVAPHSHFAIVGAKGTTPRGFSSGFSSKKNVLIELYSPEGTNLNTFQRGEKGDGWGAKLKELRNRGAGVLMVQVNLCKQTQPKGKRTLRQEQKMRLLSSERGGV